MRTETHSSRMTSHNPCSQTCPLSAPYTSLHVYRIPLLREKHNTMESTKEPNRKEKVCKVVRQRWYRKSSNLEVSD